MQDPGGTEAAGELYQLAPVAFTAARDERARQARAAGDSALARSIMKLRRPAVSAWLVNRLAADSRGELDELLELGPALREAQRSLAGNRLRELSERRRQITGALLQQARRTAADAGVAVTAQAEREVAETLDAALADPDAAGAVTSGMLTRPLSHVGLGDQDAAAVIAFPSAQLETARPASRPGAAREAHAGARTTAGQQKAARAAEAESTAAAQAVERKAREAEQTQRDLAEAREMADQARHALDQAERRLAGARDRRQAAQQRAAELERLLSEIQAEQAALARAVRDAQRNRDTAARWLLQADQRLARLRERAGHAT